MILMNFESLVVVGRRRRHRRRLKLQSKDKVIQLLRMSDICSGTKKNLKLQWKSIAISAISDFLLKPQMVCQQTTLTAE